MKTNKNIIDDMCDFEFFKSKMSKKEFFNRFDLSMGLVAEIAAKDSVRYNNSINRSMTKNELEKFKRGEF